MPTRYLLDTNTASYIIKGNMPHVREQLLRVPLGQVSISVVTEAELLFGAARLPESARLQKAVDEFLLRVDRLPWDSDAARQHACLRADLEGHGVAIGNLDLMIAAHALATGAVLVSHDRAFRRVKDLRIEDWSKP